MATNYFNAPVGGTTSLPQYLQQKQSQQGAPGSQQPQQVMQTLQSGGTQVAGQTAAPAKKEPMQATFGAGAGGSAGAPQPKPAVAPAPQPVGPISSTGNPTIPAAPPVQPPVTAVPGGTQVTEQAPANGGFDFGSYLQHQLAGQGGQGRYGNDLISSLRQSMNDELTAQQAKQQDALVADAAARGVYHGSPLTSSEGDLAAQFQRLRQQGNNDLLTQIANANATDQQNAIGNMFQFGNGQLSQQQLQAYILQLLAQQGTAGGPTIPGAIGDYSSLPTPGAPDYSGIYQMLGGLYGPKPQPAAGAAK